MVRLAPADAGAGSGLPGRRGRPAWSICGCRRRRRCARTGRASSTAEPAGGYAHP